MWWVLKDVCDILKYNNTRSVANRIDNDEKDFCKIETFGGKQNMIVINEKGLYNIFLRTPKPEAKRMKYWIMNEILPSIHANNDNTLTQTTKNEEIHTDNDYKMEDNMNNVQLTTGLQVFKNEEFGEVRTVEENGQIYFCGSDVAKALGYAKPQNAISTHCKGIRKRSIPHPQTNYTNIEMNFIPESDLYRLITGSKLKSAEKFKDWLFGEILPNKNRNIEESSKMNQLQIFNYDEKEVRTLQRDDEIWWVLKDVCDVLGLSSPHKVAERLNEDELTRTKFVSGGQNREMYIINKKGLYNVILFSRKPEAKKIKDWIMYEMIPSIHKNNECITPKMTQDKEIYIDDEYKMEDNMNKIQLTAGLQAFRNEEFGSLEILMIDEKPYFPAIECAEILGYTNPRKAVRDHCPHGTNRSVGVETGVKADGTPSYQTVEKKFIPEGDLYRLIIRSKLPNAVQFEKWVFDEILPSIRKTGGYIPISETDTEMDIMAKAIMIGQRHLEEKTKQIEQMQLEAEENKPKIDLANAIMASDDTISVGALAKLLCDLGMKTGQNRLFDELRDDGFLIKRNGVNYNIPNQIYVEKGILTLKESTITLKTGEIIINVTPLITGKGQDYFIKYFTKKHNLGNKNT